MSCRVSKKDIFINLIKSNVQKCRKTKESCFRISFNIANVIDKDLIIKISILDQFSVKFIDRELAS